MKQLMNLELFSLLSKETKNSNFFIELEKAYEEFAVTLLNKLQKEADIVKPYYNLSFVRLELAAIHETLSGGQGKNA